MHHLGSIILYSFLTIAGQDHTWSQHAQGVIKDQLKFVNTPMLWRMRSHVGTVDATPCRNGDKRRHGAKF